jgi:hypothetical protein
MKFSQYIHLLANKLLMEGMFRQIAQVTGTATLHPALTLAFHHYKQRMDG